MYQFLKLTIPFIKTFLYYTPIGFSIYYKTGEEYIIYMYMCIWLYYVINNYTTIYWSLETKNKIRKHINYEYDYMNNVSCSSDDSDNMGEQNDTDESDKSEDTNDSEESKDTYESDYTYESDKSNDTDDTNDTNE